VAQWRKTLFCVCIFIGELPVSARYNNQKAYEAKFVVVVQQKPHSTTTSKKTREAEAVCFGALFNLPDYPAWRAV